MNHFFCSTPLQIFTSIALVSSNYKNEDNAIYVLDYFLGSEECVCRIKSTNLFTQTKLVRAKTIYDSIMSNEVGHVKTIWRKAKYYLRCRKYLRNLGIGVDNNDRVFFSYLEPICLMLTNYCKQKKIKLHFIGIEDGIGAYTYLLDRAERRADHILASPPYFAKELYWVYRPEFILHPENYIGRIKQIIMPIDDYSFIKNIDDIWAVPQDEGLLKELLFFDDLTNEKDLIAITNCLSSINKDCILVKKHPRRMDQEFYERKAWSILLPQDIPFECFALKYNLNNKVLISIFSSAVVNAVFMFNQRPTIVFLYKIVSDDEYKNREKEIDMIVDRIKEIYKDDTKVIIPRNLREFESFVLGLRMII